MSCPAVVKVTVPGGPSIVKVVTPGPPGAAGAAGPQGPAGVGSAWRQGTGAPSSGTGVNGDYYLDTATGDIYGPKTAGAWGASIYNIAEGQEGPAGPTGPAGATGPQGPTGATGAQGPAGATGPAGPAGADATYSDATPQALGAASAGTASSAARSDHRHAMPTPAQVGADPSGTAVAAIAAHVAAENPHPGYATDADVAAVQARLDAFRDARTFYVSKGGSDTANGTSPGEPLLTIGAAVTAANAYVTANAGQTAKISVGPGRFVEGSLPFRLKPNILAQGSLQRGTIIEPAAGQELNGFWALDSGCMVADFRFAGHQATGTSTTDSTVGTRAWAVRFNEAANSGAGVILTASPYVKDCASITAEDDAGLAGSTSTGDTGGGVEVDGAKCHPDSPIRSILVYGFTQQNLGGPGCIVKNDGYAELVSFFGLFGTWHVQCETGGQATLSGGGCSEFGIYGLVADGYSSTALYTGTLRVAASAGALTVDVTSMTANRLGTSSRPASGQIMLLASTAYVVQSSTPIDASGGVVADTAPTRAGYRVTFYNPGGSGLAGNVSQGATADFRQRSQISAGCHSANYVGSGTNYSALPWNGGVPVRANEAVERNLGRVFGLIVNDVGDVKIAGGAFSVDGTTGAVTINTSQFNLSGLNAIGPFSRNGGVSTVGVQLQEVSNNTSLLASTGSADGNTAPTQYAVTQYLQTYYQPLDADLTAIAGLSTTSFGRSLLTQTDASGTRTTLGLSTVAASGAYSDLSGRPTLGTAAALDSGTGSGNVPVLDGAGKVPSALLPSYVDDVIEGANLAAFPATGETSKVYVALDTGKAYRWSGSAYVEISASPGSTDAVPEGSVNLYFTTGRASAAAPVQSVAGRTGAVSLSVTDVSGAVATTDSRLTTDLAYDTTTRTLSSSTGADAVLPLADASGAGLLAAADKTRIDQLGADDSPTFAGATFTGLVTASHIHGSVAGSLYIHVKNTSGGALAKGTPVRVTGAVGDTTTLEVAAADAASAGTMPAVGILDAALDNNAEGHAVVAGEVTGLATTGSSAGQTLYVASGGGLTATRPTSQAQAVAVVGRVHASTGTVAVTIDAIVPGTDLAYDVATRGLSSSTGADVTLPLFDASGAGLTPASGGGTTNFLRADGAWAAPIGSVTSVGLSAPTGFDVSGSPVTGAGTLTFSFASGYSLPTTTSQANWDTAYSERRQWDGSGTNLDASAARVSLGLGTAATQNVGTSAGNVVQLDASGNLPTLGPAQLTALGLGVAPASGWGLQVNGGAIANRVSVTASSGTYTLDIQAGNEFVTSAAINGATTINLSNTANLPSGYVWRGTLSFAYTSGTISWFTGNSGFTVKWDGGSAMTPTASETEKVVIEVVGGGTTIEVAPLKGRA